MLLQKHRYVYIVLVCIRVCVDLRALSNGADCSLNHTQWEWIMRILPCSLSVYCNFVWFIRCDNDDKINWILRDIVSMCFGFCVMCDVLMWIVFSYAYWIYWQINLDIALALCGGAVRHQTTVQIYKLHNWIQKI